jgi:uncharacterized protein
VKDPREVAKPGDVVRVKVLEVDAARKRIALTMRLDQNASESVPRGRSATPPVRMPKSPVPTARPASSAGGLLADALRRAGMQSPEQTGKPDSRRSGR